MPDRNQERSAVALFIDAVRLTRSVEPAILKDNAADFPDFALFAAGEYRARGEEAVLVVSPRGVENVTPSPGCGVTGVLVPGPARRISPPEWIAKALEQKGRANRYGPAERARTTLLIDCSSAVLIAMEDAAEVRRELNGSTLGFEEVWCVSTNWTAANALLFAP